MISNRKFGPYYVLMVPMGEKKDVEGREVGTDWFLASLGNVEADDGKSYDVYVTTDHVHASEYSYVVPDSDECAVIFAQALQKWFEEKHK
jgi:hypothetical protein